MYPLQSPHSYQQLQTCTSCGKCGWWMGSLLQCGLPPSAGKVAHLSCPLGFSGFNLNFPRVVSFSRVCHSYMKMSNHSSWHLTKGKDQRKAKKVRLDRSSTIYSYVWKLPFILLPSIGGGGCSFIYPVLCVALFSPRLWHASGSL